MSNNPFVSVLIPLYRSESYLYELFRQLEALTYNNIEIIFLDDCSPDNTRILCTEYRAVSRHEVSILCHSSNLGYSASINYLIKEAKGDYLWILDHDDRFSPEFVQKLIDSATATSADLVCCEIHEVADSDLCLEHWETLKEQTYMVSKSSSKLIYSGKVDGFVFNKLIRRNIIPPSLFPIGMRGFPDMCAIVRLMPHIRNISFVPDVLYKHILRTSSSSASNRESLSGIEVFSESLISSFPQDFRNGIPISREAQDYYYRTVIMRMVNACVREDRIAELSVIRRRIKSRFLFNVLRTSRREGVRVFLLLTLLKLVKESLYVSLSRKLMDIQMRDQARRWD